MVSPAEPDFLEVLPMLRRAFTGFGAVERRRLLDQVDRGPGRQQTTVSGIDEEAFARSLPLLKLILGIDRDDDAEP
jgi:Family of unknown function (DUF5682)